MSRSGHMSAAEIGELVCLLNNLLTACISYVESVDNDNFVAIEMTFSFKKWSTDGNSAMVKLLSECFHIFSCWTSLFHHDFRISTSWICFFHHDFHILQVGHANSVMTR